MADVSIISVKDYNSFFGKLVGFFMGKKNGQRKYNHTAILIGNYVYEKSMGKGFNRIHLDHYKQDKEVYIHRNIYAVNHITMINDIDSLSGVKYNWLYSFSYLFKRWLILDSNNRLNCVQFVERLFNMQGISIIKGRYFDPESLYRFLISV